MTEQGKEIIRILKQMSGRYSARQIFSDWITCCALAIANNATPFQNARIRDDRECEYLELMKKYSEEECEKFVRMLVLLTKSLEEKKEDILGEIYMQTEQGNKYTGQFFTPYHVSLMCAKMTLKEPDKYGRYTISEPSCGSGGMIIAAAQILQEQGENYQHVMRVVAQDLDWTAVYMCYVQLSLLGIYAIVVQGDTLSEPYYTGGYPYERVFRTPMAAGILL